MGGKMGTKIAIEKVNISNPGRLSKKWPWMNVSAADTFIHGHFFEDPPGKDPLIGSSVTITVGAIVRKKTSFFNWQRFKMPQYNAINYFHSTSGHYELRIRS